jgi:hypothetical protein
MGKFNWNKLKRYTEAYLIVGFIPAIILPIILTLSTWIHMNKIEEYQACVAYFKIYKPEGGLRGPDDDEYVDNLEAAFRILMFSYMLFCLQYALIVAPPYRKHYRWYGVSSSILLVLGLIAVVTCFILTGMSECEPKDVALASVVRLNTTLMMVVIVILAIGAHLLYFIDCCGKGDKGRAQVSPPTP